MKRLFLILFSLYTLLAPHLIHSQWVQQTLPVNGIITDIAFLNANTGFIAIADSSWLLKTTNGGTNWSVLPNFKIWQLEKIDSLTIYGLNSYNSGTKLYRSFNGGSTWDTVGIGGMCSMSFITKDTGFISTLSGIYKTTDGGISAQFLSNQTNCGIISFVKQQYNGQYFGFIAESGSLFKTTNSGVNWININNGLGNNAYKTMFANKDTGWAIAGSSLLRLYKTTDAGTNWILQPLPLINGSSNNEIGDFVIINKDTLYGVGGDAYYPLPNFVRGIIYKTTNGGSSWGYQQPDTSYPVLFYNVIDAIDASNVWAYKGPLGVHTTSGGGIIVFTGIDKNNNSVPKEISLYQNYPNPFNPSTVIRFSINRSSYVSLKVYDVLGKEVLRIYDNEYLKIGNYRADLDFTEFNISSGIYLYTLTATNNYKNFSETKKMAYIK